MSYASNFESLYVQTTIDKDVNLPPLQVIVLQLVADNPTLANNDPKYSTIINATIICVAIHSALSYSGNFEIEYLILNFDGFFVDQFLQVECIIQCWLLCYLVGVKGTIGQTMY